MKTFIKCYFILSAFLCLTGCENGFLDKSPDKKLLVPRTLTDMQSLLDYHAVMNVTPYMTLISADDYYVTDAGLQSMTLIERNSYRWADDIYENSTVGDWNRIYEKILYANIVLESLKEIPQQSDRYNQIKGTALFFRALGHFSLAQEFCVAYDNSTAATEPGIPVRLSADVNQKLSRGSLKQTYDQILADLQIALELLPRSDAVKTRPSQLAASALLARVYLSMENYEIAAQQADACLALSDELLDYNSLTSTLSSAVRPFPDLFASGINPEVLFYAPVMSVGFLTATFTIVDSVLFKSYDPDDLRRSLFFVDRGKGVVNFKGSYSGRITVTMFAGLATDEVYLIAAESNARIGKAEKAATLINALLVKRWKSGKFKPFTPVSAEHTLQFILGEKRKELVSRGTRWADLKRLNKNSLFADTIKRLINKQLYVLAPGDKKYTFPIPEQEIKLGNLEQNPR